ncbi:MAG: formate--phosphoribosylaminoimidazolecarboxamide ligase, partial [Candidatus Heimdallarchaeota archaeon]|nr:formate--phosphoribosylaminoimidazolecarboxamide ligase [Candidatus Heimdallarchaeota archaeon]
DTVLYVIKGREEFYQSLDLANELIILDNYQDIFSQYSEDVIIIPHGSFVAYLSLSKLMDSNLKLFGNKDLLIWEHERAKKELLMNEAGLKLPKDFSNQEEIKFPVIVKYDGAEGGKGYFIAKNETELKDRLNTAKPSFIQEFIIGTKVYTTYFNSIIRNRLEIFGTDIRYESDVDTQIQLHDNPAFQIVGNIPMVLRESLLINYFNMGKAFAKVVHEKLEIPMIGPFCLETVIDRNLDIYTFEFSGRIVAGTNIFVPTSPYGYIQFGKNMSMGRRIALEIREAIESDRLNEVII